MDTSNRKDYIKICNTLSRQRKVFIILQKMLFICINAITAWKDLRQTLIKLSREWSNAYILSKYEKFPRQKINICKEVN